MPEGRQYYDRYRFFRNDGQIASTPFIPISERTTDKFIVYKLGETRLDKVSQTYYGTPYYNWLIMNANPQFGGFEFNINDGDIVRVPFPFKDAIQEFETKTEQYINQYGNQ